MQLMTWIIGRLGSRFSLLFEPYRRRVMHSGTGQFLGAGLELTVGLDASLEAALGMDPAGPGGPGGPGATEPSGDSLSVDGAAECGLPRVFPFTRQGRLLTNCEMFERFNSVTYRGYCPPLGCRLEFNVHSVFYPQDEPLCLIPAMYLEVRVNPAEAPRFGMADNLPSTVPLVFGVRRPDTVVQARGRSIDLSYDAPIDPLNPAHRVPVRERILSLNEACTAVERAADGPEDRAELRLDLPVSEEGSGVKWRLVWACYVDEPVLNLHLHRDDPERTTPAALRYTRVWGDLDAVLDDAVRQRDAFLAKSRRIEKMLEQTPLDGSLTHLMNLSWQQYLANTFWCVYPDPDAATPTAKSPDATASDTTAPDEQGADRAQAAAMLDWFSVWEGSNRFHSTLDVEYNNSMFYFAFWPQLLGVQFQQWARFAIYHGLSGGKVLCHDLGMNANVAGAKYFLPMEVEENANYLLMLQAYTRWTADLRPARSQRELVEDLARYLVWTDRDDSGFPVEGTTNTAADARPTMKLARKQTYLAVKRIAGLQAAADLLRLIHSAPVPRYRGEAAAGFPSAGSDEAQATLETASALDARAERDIKLVEQAAWLGDHYAICVDVSAAGLIDPESGTPLQLEELPDWDAFSIYTGNALLLPAMIGRPPVLLHQRLRGDLRASLRENRHRYGAGNTSAEPQNVRISQNIWRDLVAQYIKFPAYRAPLAQRHWDLQLMANTHEQSRGFVDTYMSDACEFYPRGVTSLGHLLSGPRLTIDRLAPDPANRGLPGRVYLTVNPERHHPARWPLFPLADWRAGKVPICVVDEDHHVSIEGRTDPIIIHRAELSDTAEDADAGPGAGEENDVIG